MAKTITMALAVPVCAVLAVVVAVYALLVVGSRGGVEYYYGR